MYDILITSARVYDGLGGTPYVADVALLDGKIARIADKITEQASTVIDATGLALSPGWVDSHSHSDNMLFAYPAMKEKLEQGIVCAVTGQCGFSQTPKRCADGTALTGENYYADMNTNLKQGGYSLPLVGFNTLRSFVMGKENRAATPEEIQAMQALLRDEMRAGAAGLSLGLIYIPGCYASTEEVIAVASVVKEFEGVLASHIRDEGAELLSAVEEFLTVIRATGCRAIFSHHKASGGRRNWGLVHKSLAMIDKANAEGLDVYLDVYPYTASHTSLSATFLPNDFHPEGCTNVYSLLDDEEVKKKIKARFDERYEGDYSWVMIAKCLTHPEYQGELVTTLAEKQGVSPMDFIFSLLRECPHATGCYFTACEEDLMTVISHPRAMIGTDSSLGGDLVYYHPRLRATFPRVLGRYIREKGVVSLEEMIRKMTSLPAHVYGLKNKGIVREGMDADLCLFDPARIADKADFKHPTRANEGLSYVIVDGKIAVIDGEQTDLRAGKILIKK